jgi:beta-alanine degradation protein BauB
MNAPRPLAQPTKQLETERLIVTEWRFAPHAETGWHVHGYDYTVVPITTGTLLIETKTGDLTAELATGISYARDAGVEHNVVNDNDFEFIFVEVELK